MSNARLKDPLEGHINQYPVTLDPFDIALIISAIAALGDHPDANASTLDRGIKTLTSLADQLSEGSVEVPNVSWLCREVRGRLERALKAKG